MGWLDNLKDKKESDQAKAVLKAIPDSLKDKSLDEITALLNEAPQLKTKLGELETSRTSDTEKVTTLSRELADTKARLASIEGNRQQAPQNQNEELANFVEEPDKAFTQRVGPVASLAVRTSAQTARILAQQQLDNSDMSSNGKIMDGRLFRAWGGEIDQEAQKYQTVQLTDPKAWIGIFYYLKGTKADELRDPEIRKTKYNFLEPSVVGGAPPPEKKNDDVLTDEEKRVAARMGVSEENYLKRKKAIRFVGA
jgi:phage I-like protein